MIARRPKHHICSRIFGYVFGPLRADYREQASGPLEVPSKSKQFGTSDDVFVPGRQLDPLRVGAGEEALDGAPLRGFGAQ